MVIYTYVLISEYTHLYYDKCKIPFLSWCSKFAPRFSSSKTKSVWPPAHANVKAVSWLLSVWEFKSTVGDGDVCWPVVVVFDVWLIEAFCRGAATLSVIGRFVCVDLAVFRRKPEFTVVSVGTAAFADPFCCGWTSGLIVSSHAVTLGENLSHAGSPSGSVWTS